jgi:hypothetical protein
MTMNTGKWIVAVFSAAGPAFIQACPYVEAEHMQAPKTRAQVMEELKAAREDPRYVVGGREFVPPDEHFVSTKSRSQVIEELKQSRKDGSYQRMHWEFQD